MLENPVLRWMNGIYSFFVNIGSNLQSLFLLYMRLTWGHQSFLAGVEKLKHIEQTAQLFTQLHLPAPFFHAYAVGILEAVCGILLVIGLASRLAAIPLIVIMLTALTTAHAEYLAHFRFLIEPHILVIQQPYPLLIMAFLVFIFGPGRISFDAWIKRWVSKQPRY